MSAQPVEAPPALETLGAARQLGYDDRGRRLRARTAERDVDGTIAMIFLTDGKVVIWMADGDVVTLAADQSIRLSLGNAA